MPVHQLAKPPCLSTLRIRFALLSIHLAGTARLHLPNRTLYARTLERHQASSTMARLLQCRRRSGSGRWWSCALALTTRSTEYKRNRSWRAPLHSAERNGALVGGCKTCRVGKQGAQFRDLSLEPSVLLC